MLRSAKLVAAVAVAALSAPGTARAAADASTCASGTARTAAVELFGAGTDVVRVTRIAGLRTALVSEPRIAPGTRRRMIRAGRTWCEAAAGFNRAWRLSGRSAGDGRAMAQAYARLAAAPYFDGVTVKSTEAGAAGTLIVRTHARTNGVEARWVVTTDAGGIRAATWTATAFAKKPFVASWEGLTALPGASERYVRRAGGLLDDARGLPTAASAQARRDDGDPGLLEHTFEDGFTIVTSVGDAHAGVDIGADTGVRQVDVLRATMRAARENYEEFLSWGLTKGWEPLPAHPEDVGYVYVNDALSLFCLACVFISDDFQIHMLSEVNAALDVLGYDGYVDRKDAYSLIIGHEMFHNFQNRYNKPGHFNTAGRGTPASYSEGTARFQETLHDYAGATFAPNTLVTANDSNGCNGFDTGGSMSNGMGSGPFGKTYNTCFFWAAWYVDNGKEAFLDLLREGMPAHSPEEDTFLKMSRATEQATGKSIADQLASFAASAITGHGRAWATWSGTEPLNWGSLLERWTPSKLNPGFASNRALGAGGVMAREIVADTRVSLRGKNTVLYVVRDDGTRAKARRLKGDSASIGGPEPGQRVYVLAVNATPTSEVVTLRAGQPGKPPAPPVAGPAQPPVTGSVVVRAPGAGERVNNLTSARFVFKVPDGYDNARAEVVATNLLPGDVDLYLQHRNDDVPNSTDPGAWSDSFASGTSGDLLGETMSMGRMPAGDYRIEVHNWAGPPNQVKLELRFFNSNDQPGVAQP